MSETNNFSAIFSINSKIELSAENPDDLHSMIKMVVIKNGITEDDIKIVDLKTKKTIECIKYQKESFPPWRSWKP